MTQENHTDPKLLPLDAMVAFITDVFGPSDAIGRHILETEVEQVGLPQGQTLYEQGDPGDSMYVLVRGHLGVRLLRIAPFPGFAEEWVFGDNTPIRNRSRFQRCHGNRQVTLALLKMG
jgi:hypothetical protein